MRWQTIWQCIIAPGVPRRSLAAAVVVGTLLNLINQGDALFSGRRLDWLKVVLTYIVPIASRPTARWRSASKRCVRTRGA